MTSCQALKFAERVESPWREVRCLRVPDLDLCMGASARALRFMLLSSFLE
jgi:hypothetical protein